MGVRKYDVNATAAAYSTAKSTGNTGFAYSQRASASGLHQSVHPGFGGQRVCNDYPDMPALPVSFLMDFTGSNIHAASSFYNKLGDFMSLLVAQGWVKNQRPVVQFLGMDDYLYMPDEWAQITPFEADGPTTLQWLSKMWLTSNGGGNGYESYEEMFWILTHQNKLQAWDRGAKGRLFILCDELIKPQVSASALERLYAANRASSDIALGPNQSAKTVLDLPAADLNTTDVVRDLLSKYDTYVFRGAESTDYQKDPRAVANWEQYFPKERIIYLPDSAEGPYMAAALIGQEFGIPTSTIQSALSNLSASRELVKAVGDIKGIVPVARDNKALRRLT